MLKKLTHTPEKILGFIIEHELQSLYLLSPIFFALGVIIYFDLSFEPQILYSSLALAFAVLSCFIAYRFKKFFFTVLFISFFAGGFFFGNLRGYTSKNIVIENIDKPIWVRADLVKIEKKDKQTNLLLKNLDLWRPDIKKFPSERTPYKIRVTVRTKIDDGIRIGDKIAFKAILSPPAQRPVLPDGYDFNRISYFQNIGAVGFAITPVKLFEKKRAGFIDTVQDYIANKINASVKDKDLAGMIVAQITADRVEISQETKDKIKNAGLSHLLAISGLNMSVAMIWMLFLSRSIFAFFPRIALKYDTKKLSVLVAVIFGLLYLLVTGMPVSAVRAFLMVLLFFIAIMADRFSISLHPVAFAALVILMIAPENIIAPGFQLSFAAVIALIGFYEMHAQYYKKEEQKDRSFVIRNLLLIGSIISSTFFTSLTTAPFLILHFGTFQNYGILSNMIGVPVVSILVLPFAFLSIFFMPLGLEKPFLIVAEFGTKIIRDTSYFISSKEHAVTYLGDIPNGFIIFVALGFLTLFIFKTRVRLVGIPLILSGYLLLFQTPEKPDFVINETGSLIALKQADNNYKYYGINRQSFAQYEFNNKLGVEKPDFIKSNPTCNRKKCIYKNIAFGNTLQTDDCRKYDYIFNLGKNPVICDLSKDKTVVIDKATLSEKGSHLVFLDEHKLVTASDGIRNRAWNDR